MKKITLLPNKIKVHIFKGKSGVWIAELPEYELHTESDSVFELIPEVNDLIHTFFDVPKKFRNELMYYPPQRKQQKKDNYQSLVFHKFVKPEARACFC